MSIRKYCRRFKYKGMVGKLRADTYDDPSLHAPEQPGMWFWLDQAPFVEEYADLLAEDCLPAVETIPD